MKMDSLNTNENDLLDVWFKSMFILDDAYVEPILDQYTTGIIKLACDTFKQDIHVFVMSVQVLEDYIRAKIDKNETIVDNVLVISAVIFISSKYVGEQVDLKLPYVNTFLEKITGHSYDHKTVRAAELDVLAALEQKLPILTVVDDLNTLVEKYVLEYRLKINIRPLCTDILEFLYIIRDKWFFDMKNLYSQNEASVDVFKVLVRSKFYLPTAVLIAAVKSTNFEHIFNIEKIIEDLSVISKIHVDHLNALCTKILDCISSYKPVED